MDMASLTEQLRIGQGYDIHRLVPGKPLWIGGVQVDSPVGSDAHSDGDALLHALIDALLGAAGLGDIGDHFPPSNPEYKGISSSILLSKVMALLTEKNLRLVNVDTTIFLEQPKLYPYKETIRMTLSRLLNLPIERVSLKAKTAEGFPPVGTSEAIATSASVLVTG